MVYVTLVCLSILKSLKLRFFNSKCYNSLIMITELSLITTYRCNLNCHHCLQKYPQEKNDFPIKLLPSLLHQAKQFGVQKIHLTGGEPGLHPHFNELVQEIDKNRYAWNILSNGTETSKYLQVAELYPDTFQGISFSLDGATEKAHNILRNNPLSFNEVILSIKDFVSKGYRVQTKTCLNQENKNELMEIINLGSQLSVSAMRFGALIPTKWNEHLQLNYLERDKLYKHILRMKQWAKPKLYTSSSLHTKGGINFCRILDSQKISINPLGEMIFCCNNEKNKGIIGSLYDYSLTELITKFISISSDMKISRAKRISSGKMGEGFDSCFYCKEYFDY